MKKKKIYKEPLVSFHVSEIVVAEGAGMMADQVFIATSLPPSEKGKGNLEFIAVSSLGDTVDVMREVFKVEPTITTINLRAKGNDEMAAKAAESGQAAHVEVPDNSDVGEPISFIPRDINVVHALGYPDQVIVFTKYPSLIRGAEYMSLVFMADEFTGAKYAKDNFNFTPKMVEHKPKG